LALTLAVLWGRSYFAGDPPREAKIDPTGPGPAAAGQPEQSIVADLLVADDGRTMWASPTAGRPLSWEYLPPGAQLVLALRPAALAAHPEGEKVLAALGPLGAAGKQSIERITGLEWRQMDRLLVGWQPGANGALEPTIVVFADRALLKERSSGGDGRAYYRPERSSGPALVIAPAAAMREIIALGGNPPPLRRDVERLLALTDADRHASLLVAPGFLFNEGRAVFDDELSGLRQPLVWFLGEGLSAAAISLHWDENFFVEFMAAPTLDAPPGRVAEQLVRRVADLPGMIETYSVALDASPHGRRVVARFPAMVRKLATYTRGGFDRDHVLLRCYLPAVAGHNLLMGAELALAEPLAGPATPAAASPRQIAAAPAGNPPSILERLERRASLRTGRDSLESVLQQLAAELGAPIVILGRDLQLDGITRNQMLAADFSDRPAGEILIEILRQANPDKAATGPNDPRQKLVYRIGPESPGGPDVILITTRAAAAERGDTLPAPFQSD
jgi:hypothetical protein